MTPKEIKERLASGEEIELLDVREGKEFEECEKNPIPGAKNVPMGQVFVNAKKEELPKNKKIITICKTGGRCEVVASAPWPALSVLILSPFQ